MSVVAMQVPEEMGGRARRGSGRERRNPAGAVLRLLGGAFTHGHDRPGDDLSGDRRVVGRSKARSLRMFKPATYSVMHLLVAVAVAYALTRDWRIALGVGIVEPLVQTVAYTLHEHVWSKVRD